MTHRFPIQISVLFLAIAFLFGVAFALFAEAGMQRSSYLFQAEIDDQKQSIVSLVELKGASVRRWVDDYTFWDDMVEFAETGAVAGQDDFAYQNLDTSIGTFDIDAAWVLRRNGELVYFVDAEGSHEPRAIPVPAEAREAFFSELALERSAHFFAYRPDGVAEEVVAMTVHPTADPERKTPPRGFLVAARTLDAAWLEDIAQLSHANVALVPAETSKLLNHVRDRSRGIVAFSYLLPSRDGVPAAVLEVEREAPIVREFAAFSRKQALLYGAFVFVATFVIGLFSFRWTRQMQFLSS